MSAPGPQQQFAAAQRHFGCQGVSGPSADMSGRPPLTQPDVRNGPNSTLLPAAGPLLRGTDGCERSCSARLAESLPGPDPGGCRFADKDVRQSIIRERVSIPQERGMLQAPIARPARKRTTPLGASPKGA